MALTDGYMTLPDVVAWLATKGYPLGKATLRAACLAYAQGLPGSMHCEKVGTSRAATYFVWPEDALTFARGKHQTSAKRGRGRPAGTVGRPRIKKSATSASGGAGDGT